MHHLATKLNTRSLALFAGRMRAARLALLPVEQQVGAGVACSGLVHAQHPAVVAQEPGAADLHIRYVVPALQIQSP